MSLSHGKILYETKPFEEVSRVETIRMGQIIPLQTRWLDFPMAVGHLLGMGFCLDDNRSKKATTHLNIQQDPKGKDIFSIRIYSTCRDYFID